VANRSRCNCRCHEQHGWLGNGFHELVEHPGVSCTGNACRLRLPRSYLPPNSP
jgi:hypothetical protein